MDAPAHQESFRQNRLLRALSPAVRQPLLLALELIPLSLRERLIEPDVPIPYVYFPLHGVVSLISTLGDGTQVEVATIGNEGLIGLHPGTVRQHHPLYGLRPSAGRSAPD